MKPFKLEPGIFELQISGAVQRKSGRLDMLFRIEGNLERVLWPVPETSFKRCHHLWQTTCCEFFFGIPGQTDYWEVNLSPAGLWNIYRFTDYRTEMRQENAITPKAFETLPSPMELTLSCILDVSGQVNDFKALQVGMACVIEDTDKTISYWAMDHFGSTPDFHNRAGFLAELEPLALKRDTLKETPDEKN